MEPLLNALKGLAEPTRLRILQLCLQSDLTVSELVRILGQSQPRVSRHLKLLCEAGLLERFREGNWVFHRIADSGLGGELINRLQPMVPVDGLLKRDRDRLGEVKRDRREAAASYFRKNAVAWDEVRSFHIDEAEVEEAVRGLLAPDSVDSFLDIGTGTGRMLELYGPGVRRGQGIDLSRDMLSVARANLESAGLTNCQVRQGDLYQLPVAAESFDAAVLHQVLHFIADQALAVTEAARVLKPGGRLLIVDFAPHRLESLRDEHEHRRLGFDEEEVAGWLVLAGLELKQVRHLPGDPLTVSLWLAEKTDPMKPAARPLSRNHAGQAF